MFAQDVVDKLSAAIPKHTAGFSNAIAVLSIVPTGTTALATTDGAHGLVDGQTVAILGATAPVQVDTASFLRTGSQAVFATLQDHDFTLSERDKAAGGKTLTISGATESEFNGTFQILNVMNRRELIIAVDDSGSTTISGSPLVDDANGGLFNGLFPVSNITANTFEYELPISYPLPATGSITAQISIRILSVIDVDQYLNDVYTKQTLGDDVLVVQLGDVTMSQNRGEKTDASDSSVGGDSYTPVLIQTFAIYIIQNVTDLLSGSPARDKVEREYIPAICQSVLLAAFDTGFAFPSQYRSTFTGHGVYAFADQNGKNKALYVHEISFQQLCSLERAADTAASDDSVAMRDVSYTLTTDLGTGELLADVDLDQVPLT